MSDDLHHFEFDLDRGIREQVLEKLKNSPKLPLLKDSGPKQSGIYAIYYEGELVYVGKASKSTTKSGRTLRQRLSEHFHKFSDRNVPMRKMRCQYLTFNSEWWVFAAEFALITALKPKWQGSGLGSKTPGAGRPGTNRVSVFDTLFPK